MISQSNSYAIIPGERFVAGEIFAMNEETGRGKISRDFLALSMLALTALCLGLLLNQMRNHPLPLVYQSKAEGLQRAVERISQNKAAPVSLAGKNLTLETFREIVEQRKALILDARPEIFHRLGHVPGAVSLSREDFENRYIKLRGILEKDKNQPLVVYCAGSDCEESELVQQALAKLNFTNVAVFRGGWAAWTQAGLPKETP